MYSSSFYQVSKKRHLLALAKTLRTLWEIGQTIIHRWIPGAQIARWLKLSWFHDIWIQDGFIFIQIDYWFWTLLAGINSKIKNTERIKWDPMNNGCTAIDSSMIHAILIILPFQSVHSFHKIIRTKTWNNLTHKQIWKRAKSKSQLTGSLKPENQSIHFILWFCGDVK